MATTYSLDLGGTSPYAAATVAIVVDASLLASVASNAPLWKDRPGAYFITDGTSFYAVAGAPYWDDQDARPQPHAFSFSTTTLSGAVLGARYLVDLGGSGQWRLATITAVNS